MGSGRIDAVLRLLAIGAVTVMVLVAAGGMFGWFNLAPTAAQNNATKLATAQDANAGGYAFLLTDPKRQYPARWCADQTIGYSVDFKIADQEGMDKAEELARWERIFAIWADASNGAYRFEYIGERPMPTIANGGDWEADVDAIESGTIAISYVHGNSADSDDGYFATAVRGRTAGNGGLQVVSRGFKDSRGLVGDRGFVMIDAEDALTLAADGLRETLYLHEAGHSLGLGHVASEGSIMNGTLSSKRKELGPGDRQGVNDLATMPCEG